MSQKASFWFNKQRRVGQAEFEGALEFVPQAVLVIDSSNQRVLAANAQAERLFSSTRSGLTRKTLSQLIQFPEEFNLPAPSQTNAAPILGEINLPDQACLDVHLRFNSLSDAAEFLLITIEPVSPQADSKDGLEQNSHFWQGLNLLASAAEQKDFDQRLQTALEGVRSMAQCQFATLYLCKGTDHAGHNPEQPTIPLSNRNATRWGNEALLPETIAPQDLVLLRSIRVWDSNKRPTTSLHRAVREADFSYLASAPLGLPHTLTGLLVLGDIQKTASPDILRMIHLMAEIFSYILEDHDRLMQINRTLESQALQLRVLNAACTSVQDGIFWLAPDLKTRRINQATETIFGYKNQEVVGEPIDNILIGSDALGPALTQAQNGFPTYHLHDIKLIRRYGDPFQAVVRVQPILHQGMVESILVVVRDLSEQAAYEAHARQLAQNAEMGEVMAAFAHEVRNPIHNISTGLQVMERALPEEDAQREDIHRLLMDLDRVSNLMNSMLSTTRTSDMKPRPVDLGRLIKSQVDRLKPSITRDGISCLMNIEPDLPQISGDTRALEQIFNNLIINAVQAMKDRPQSQLVVKVQSQRATKDRVFIEASIADNGPGIPKENLDKIFQPFFTTKVDGNGLGLPLAKRIVTAHKGSITVTSFPGGTVFRVVFPANTRNSQTGPLPGLDNNVTSPTPVIPAEKTE